MNDVVSYNCILTPNFLLLHFLVLSLANPIMFF